MLTGAPFRWLRPAQRRAGPRALARRLPLGPARHRQDDDARRAARRVPGRPSRRAGAAAVDDEPRPSTQATVAVDKALQKGRRERWRDAVQRLGTRFDPTHYDGREHLIPMADRELIARLARAEAARPPAGDLPALQRWSERVAALRAELRASSLAVLRRARLASMTTTRAVGTLKTLRELAADDGEPPFDLVVFDEASEVSLAHALALMPLGRARLFAGDLNQLSPVQRSAERLARRWLGRSAFSAMPAKAPSVVLLDEQSRMAQPICALVGDLFYDGALRVADDALASRDWRAARSRAFGDVGAEVHVHVEPVARDGCWSPALRGPVRAESADAIAASVARALASGDWRPHEIVVLTPFRAQRALLRQRLAAAGAGEVKVGTVHRAQGSEAPVVLFDPVDGANPFLQTEEAGRLVNVALSRAQAKVLVWMSEADRANPLLAPIVQRLRLAGDTRAGAAAARSGARPALSAPRAGPARHHRQADRRGHRRRPRRPPVPRRRRAHGRRAGVRRGVLAGEGQGPRQRVRGHRAARSAHPGAAASGQPRVRGGTRRGAALAERPSRSSAHGDAGANWPTRCVNRPAPPPRLPARRCSRRAAARRRGAGRRGGRRGRARRAARRARGAARRLPATPAC
ncbi:MAG: DNA2/NAM7 family helicase [Comamonadaceae bacterium]|nr:DNA2/NAM7 family helicase [Comamonadaceae bacterium]